jgi:ParB family chromosome partitioning protein
MIEFIPDFPISELSPADYNPRRIDDDSFQQLRTSLNTFGVIKPVLLNGNGTLIAGHQRIKALVADKKTSVPMLRTKQVGLKDEARLNLYHNSVETNASIVKIDGSLKRGYVFIDHDRIKVVERQKPAIVAEICRLIIKYGEWGSLIVSETGEVLFNSDYAVATKLIRKQVLAYVLTAAEASQMYPFLAREYGKYNYDTLPVHNISQTKCQMHRLRDGEKGKGNRSSLYELRIIPRIDPEQRGIDFGAGYGDYQKRLAGEGYNLLAYEPFQRVSGSGSIDLPTIRAAIKRVEESVTAHGLFDYVILDSVINSVTSLEYEHFVLATCNSLLRADGVFYIGTRKNEFAHMRSKERCTRAQRNIEFLDDDGFSTIFRDGVWTKQRFHTVESLTQTLERYFDEIEMQPYNQQSKYQLHAICRRPKQLSAETFRQAIETEFNLDYSGRKLNCHSGLVDAIMLKLESNDRVS